ncbi:PadR family transcriptional regulator [Paraburkholderia sp. D15]|uniref:PadR family transcriptional regulator n=1 Tax=Paraburkholderia sp. D15 TaxID=2880218 RepID=UPI00247A5C29|nr:PadR family transcriptional regulator [Paraburkholderia sp. D15]WGS54853.1 PadR family transcriptional regulator [Paraburkholderia sp. D15]
MSIQHALLISLLEKPSTGYDLARRFDKSIGYFWHASHQQIYRELGRMTEAGWLSATEDSDGGKRLRWLYRVLAPGKAELARWVSEPVEEGDASRALLIKLRAEAVIGPHGVDEELRRLIVEHQGRLDHYLEIEQRDFAARRMSHAQKLQHAVLRAGILTEQGWLQWANEVLPVVEAAKRSARK